jgi:hypothetical protein
MTKTLDVGSYSRGTLRAVYLADVLADMLRYVEHDDEGLLADLETVATYGDSDDEDEIADLSDHERETLDNASEVIADAMDTLQQYAPPFCYVGMHEGDGSDLGVWFNHDSFEEACRDGSVLKISDSSELDDMAKEDIVSHYYIAVVSDHGNVSLHNVHVTLGDKVISLV